MSGNEDNITSDVSGRSDKNIWLAVILAVITSITSLGTALINSKGESKSKEESPKEKVLEDKVQVLNNNLDKSLEDFNSKLKSNVDRLEQIKKSIEDLKIELIKSDKNLSNSIHSINTKLTVNINNVKSLRKDLDKVEELSEKNKKRSIATISVLPKEFIDRAGTLMGSIYLKEKETDVFLNKLKSISNQNININTEGVDKVQKDVVNNSRDD